MLCAAGDFIEGPTLMHLRLAILELLILIALATMQPPNAAAPVLPMSNWPSDQPHYIRLGDPTHGVHGFIGYGNGFRFAVGLHWTPIWRWTNLAVFQDQSGHWWLQYCRTGRLKDAHSWELK